jgi:PAS domain S-box-containing protein
MRGRVRKARQAVGSRPTSSRRDVRLRALLDSLSGGLLVEDERRRITLVNREFCALFGLPLPPDRLVGSDSAQTVEDTKRHFTDAEGFAVRVEDLLAARRPAYFETLSLRDGRTLERDYIPIFERGRPREHLWLYRDVSARVRDERRLSTVHTVTVALLESTSSYEAETRLLNAVNEGLGWPFAAAWRVDPKARRLRCAVTAGADPPDEATLLYSAAARRVSLGPGECLPGQVWALDRPLFCEDVASEQGFERSELAGRLGLGAGIFAPVHSAGGVVGVLEFVCREKAARDEALVRLVAGVADQLGQFLERREAQDALRESEARSRAILESAQDAVLTIDHEGRIQEFNPAAEQLFGFPRKQVLGRRMSDMIVPPDLRADHERGLARHLRTGESRMLGRRVEMRALRGDGTTFPAEVSVIRIEGFGRPSFTGFVRDLSEREAIDRMKREFVSMVSHELRTPLTSLRGSLGLLALGTAGGLSKEAAKLLEIAERNTVRLVTLINDILDLERLSSGRVELRKRPAPLGPILALAVEAVGPLAQEKGVQLVLPAERPDSTVLVDAERIEQVLINLLGNAVKFSPSGGRVWLLADPRAESAEISVCDEGPGIPSEWRERVFEPFQQVEGSDSRTKGGSGLGLAICKAIVERHGGRIGVEPGRPTGSRFWFTVPLVS